LRATSTLIELIWLSEISDSSVQILGQMECQMNPERGKRLKSGAIILAAVDGNVFAITVSGRLQE